MKLVVTCEHGGNRVPTRFAHTFRNEKKLLSSHRGFDAGALETARALARRLEVRAPLFATTVSRLVVDTNRSLGHPRLFSAPMLRLDEAERRAALERYYHPHRQRIEAAIAELVRAGHVVLHVASHSFTPVLDGVPRRADAAWLYDPKRALEKRVVASWRRGLSELRPDLRLRRNYPYRGVADGLATYFRRRFPASRYAGIELELNQASLSPSLRRDLVRSVEPLLRA